MCVFVMVVVVVVVMNDNGCEVECGGSDGGKDDEEDSNGDDELDTSPADALWCVSEALVMLHFLRHYPYVYMHILCTVFIIRLIIAFHYFLLCCL